MLELNSLLNNDTILGACIGAIFSVFGAFVAYALNLRLEKRKMESIKKEQIYEELLKLKSLMRKKRSYIYLALNDRMEDANKLEIDEGSNLERISMIINLYLCEYKEIFTDISNTYKNINLFYQDIKYNNFIFDNSQKDEIEISLSRIKVMTERLIEEIIGD